jgi:hypothetical protein
MSLTGSPAQAEAHSHGLCVWQCTGSLQYATVQSTSGTVPPRSDHVASVAASTSVTHCHAVCCCPCCANCIASNPTHLGVRCVALVMLCTPVAVPLKHRKGMARTGEPESYCWVRQCKCVYAVYVSSSLKVNSRCTQTVGRHFRSRPLHTPTGVCEEKGGSRQQQRSLVGVWDPADVALCS